MGNRSMGQNYPPRKSIDTEPFLETLAMKGFLCFFRNLDTAGSALTKMAAISSPWRSPDVRMNAATPAFSSAIR